MEEQLNLFIDYLVNEKHSSANTLSSYRRDIRKFMTYLMACGIDNFDSVSGITVQAYILDLEKSGFASASVSRSLAAIKGMFAFLHRRSRISEDPAYGLKPPKVVSSHPDIMSVEDVSLLLSKPVGPGSKAVRDRAMLELLYATGIRVSEIISLKMDDINMLSGYVRCTRRGRKRIIPFGRLAKMALADYVEKARTDILSGQQQDILFLNCSGKPMTRQGFWKILKYYAKTAGIEADITPHTLRHSFAAHLLENGADVRAVQEMMGEADIYVTQNYVMRNNDRIRDVYLKNHPRA